MTGDCYDIVILQTGSFVWLYIAILVVVALCLTTNYAISLQLSKLPVVSFKQTPFRNSVMGRELCLAELRAGNGEKLLVATTHLESPCPAPPTWNQMFSAERVVQAKEAMTILGDSQNAIFGGDMNWDDKQDGPPPLPSGWFDAWQQLHPGQVYQFINVSPKNL